MSDIVNKPKHYNSHPSGVECIEIVKHYDFPIGNVIKYCWRSGLKGYEGMTSVQAEITDLEKARYYIDVKIAELKKLQSPTQNSPFPIIDSSGEE